MISIVYYISISIHICNSTRDKRTHFIAPTAVEMGRYFLLFNRIKIIVESYNDLLC